MVKSEKMPSKKKMIEAADFCTYRECSVECPIYFYDKYCLQIWIKAFLDIQAENERLREWIKNGR